MPPAPVASPTICSRSWPTSDRAIARSSAVDKTWVTTNDSNGRRATQPALLAVLVGGAYLAWRSTTGSGVDPLLFWPLLAAEAALYVRFVLRVAVSWRLSPVQLVPARAIRTVDVVVAAYAEPADIVRATLIGCRELRYPHRTPR